jgi:hypothetical protein
VLCGSNDCSEGRRIHGKPVARLLAGDCKRRVEPGRFQLGPLDWQLLARRRLRWTLRSSGERAIVARIWPENRRWWERRKRRDRTRMNSLEDETLEALAGRFP